MDIKPKTLTCKICGIEFTWSTGEQQFYHDRGLKEPRRCPHCRTRREEQRWEGNQAFAR